MSITIEHITSKPLSFIGRMAGICWNADTDTEGKNIKRAVECIMADHGRVLEFPDVTMVLDGESARMMRELYTHIGGNPTRLQSSTRYVDEKHFEYYLPPSCSNGAIRETYLDAMAHSADAYGKLVELGVPKEDAANTLPIGMASKMVWKVNLRTLVNFFHKRLCSRALLEIRKFSLDLKKLLGEQDNEWKWIADNLFVPQCEQYRYMNPVLVFCQENRCCGRHAKIGDITGLTINDYRENSDAHQNE